MVMKETDVELTAVITPGSAAADLVAKMVSKKIATELMPKNVSRCRTFHIN